MRSFFRSSIVAEIFHPGNLQHLDADLSKNYTPITNHIFFQRYKVKVLDSCGFICTSQMTSYSANAIAIADSSLHSYASDPAAIT